MEKERDWKRDWKNGNGEGEVVLCEEKSKEKDVSRERRGVEGGESRDRIRGRCQRGDEEKEGRERERER